MALRRSFQPMCPLPQVLHHSFDSCVYCTLCVAPLVWYLVCGPLYVAPCVWATLCMAPLVWHLVCGTLCVGHLVYGTSCLAPCVWHLVFGTFGDTWHHLQCWLDHLGLGTSTHSSLCPSLLADREGVESSEIALKSTRYM
jgi:hypothetical protein